MITVYPIVEGDGDVRSIRKLVTQVALWLEYQGHVDVQAAFKVPRSQMPIPEGNLERAVESHARRMAGDPDSWILILLDGDGDCPVTLARDLLARASKIRDQLKVSVVVADKEYEAWFLASASSLKGKVKPGTLDHPNPDSKRGAKEWLRERLISGRYTETVDQVSLTSLFDVELALKSRSFQKLVKEIAVMCGLETEGLW